jgi:hypothetical protein
MKHLARAAAFVVIGFFSFAHAAQAQQCPDCPDPAPHCPQNQQPTCEGGTWVCPEPICSETERRICEEDYCGIFDDTTCTCYTDPGGCYPCDDDERRRCIDQYCPDDGYCWDDELCICWAEDFKAKGKAPTPRQGSRSRFLGRFPPRMTSCEEDKVPTSIEMATSDIRIHVGSAVVDDLGNVLCQYCWGISMLARYAVLDQNGELLRAGGMQAYEEVSITETNLNMNLVTAPPTGVPVNNDGMFGDIFGIVSPAPPGLLPWEYSRARQRLRIRKSHNDYWIRTNCVHTTYNNIDVHACN